MSGLAGRRRRLGQHTEQTGQAFAPEALEVVWTQTAGSPGTSEADGRVVSDRSLPASQVALGKEPVRDVGREGYLLEYDFREMAGLMVEHAHP